MEPDLAAMVLDSLGLTVKDLEAAGADPYDLEPLIRPFHNSLHFPNATALLDCEGGGRTGPAETNWGGKLDATARMPVFGLQHLHNCRNGYGRRR
jgi:hypothetical protein